ncbi:MAG: hypothetical protein P0Y65_20810 [Candidatus Devosia phytovorans]|uniref:Uncharacterized protein n=1 Tax=Candidatus Devosia phytovorans TaxID=3121372 RepID=A0AAJ6B0T2_9HYPH|nr:hypothetical protein [Devosia sp.]WEK04584.1 MAG: hypothetical protein P0Y65_20810 [Devosia sp.]
MPSAAKLVLHTPDGRYIVVDGQLWRASNPSLPESERKRLVDELMDARRRMQSETGDKRSAIRKEVDAAKRALGERGPVWWDDGAPDHNRRQVQNTPYADWYLSVTRAEDHLPA